MVKLIFTRRRARTLWLVEESATVFAKGAIAAAREVFNAGWEGWKYKGYSVC